MRGISEEFATEFRKCKLYELYEKHKDELIIGIRNNYLNLYYNCDSIAKIEYKKTKDSKAKKIVCEIDKYYLGGKHYSNKEKRHRIEPEKITEQNKKIKENSDKKSTQEKVAQSKLFILNNSNIDSKWFCIDVEYVKQFNNAEDKKKSDFNGRFDIIALSKEKPHRVALIELKYGSGAISGASGIYKHVQDFSNFIEKGFFKGHLRQEIIKIIKSQLDIGISVPFTLPNENNILSPDFYFITLDNNAKTDKASTPKQTMAGYLFKNKRWNCKRLSTKYCVERDFGDITKKDNKFHATFLFSKSTIETLDIIDIIDGNYDKRIIPRWK